MADAIEKPKSTRSRRNTSGAASRASSRASSSQPGLSRPISGRHLDDHASYHGHGYHGEPQNEEVLYDDDSSDETDLTEKDTNETGIEPESSGDIVPEVRDGIEDQRDVEAGPKLEKSKTTRSGKSARDPNLVTWTGPEVCISNRSHTWSDSGGFASSTNNATYPAIHWSPGLSELA
jgi:hypothetical protein